MPSARSTMQMPMDGYEEKPPAMMPPPQHQFPSVPSSMARSPIMLASLPNVGSAPDAILRQHLGGRAVPGGRLFSL